MLTGQKRLNMVKQGSDQKSTGTGSETKHKIKEKRKDTENRHQSTLKSQNLQQSKLSSSESASQVVGSVTKKKKSIKRPDTADNDQQIE